MIDTKVSIIITPYIIRIIFVYYYLKEDLLFFIR